MKALVVYFSRKGYVRRRALAIARELGADALELKTRERTRGIPGFWWCGRFAMHRWGMDLLPLDQRLEEYAHVVICSPVWVFSAASPVWAFLRQARGRVKSAEYVLVHFSLFPMRYAKTARAMDRALGVRHSALTSIACMWGREFRKRRYDACALK